MTPILLCQRMPKPGDQKMGRSSDIRSRPMIPTSRGEHDTLVVSLDGHDSGQLIRTVSFNRGLFGKAANSLHIEKVVGGADRGFEVELRRDMWRLVSGCAIR